MEETEEEPVQQKKKIVGKQRPASQWQPTKAIQAQARQVEGVHQQVQPAQTRQEIQQPQAQCPAAITS